MLCETCVASFLSHYVSNVPLFLPFQNPQVCQTISNPARQPLHSVIFTFSLPVNLTLVKYKVNGYRIVGSTAGLDRGAWGGPRPSILSQPTIPTSQKKVKPVHQNKKAQKAAARGKDTDKFRTVTVVAGA